MLLRSRSDEPQRTRRRGSRRRQDERAGARGDRAEDRGVPRADVTVVVCSNRRYRILQFELARAGQKTPGPKALSLTDLTNPVMDWAALAKGFGVPACTVGTDDELTVALQRSLAGPGPSLIEAVVD